MRNVYPGVCYKCGEWIEPGAGHFEAPTKRRKEWRVQCAKHGRKVDPKQRTVPIIRNQQ